MQLLLVVPLRLLVQPLDQPVPLLRAQLVDLPRQLQDLLHHLLMSWSKLFMDH